MKRITFIYIIFLLLFINGCEKDKGNYSYIEIRDVEFTNIDASYSAYYLTDTLRINPEITFTRGEESIDKLSYHWYSIARNKSGFDVKKDLSDSMNLEYLVDLLPGTYDVYFTILNEVNGIRYEKQFELNVTTEAYEGWMVLSSLNGKSQLGMVSINKDGDYSVIPNVLLQTGLKETEKPIQVGYSNLMGAWENVYFTSLSGTFRVDPAFFTWNEEKEFKYEMLELYDDSNSPYKIFPVDMFSEFMISQKGYLYFKDPLSGDVFTAKKNKNESGDEFRVAPYVAYGLNTFSVDAVVFDSDNQKFLKLPYKASRCVTIPDGNLFSFSTNKDLVYMSNSLFNNADTFAILVDNEGDYYLYRFNVGFTEVTQSYYDKIHSTKITQDSHFAVHPTLGYIFFTNGGQLYQYDMNLREAKLMEDFGNQTISLIKFNTFTGTGKYYQPIYQSLEQSLLVGVYNPSASDIETSGSLKVYEVPTVNKPLIQKEEYSGMPEIIDVVYRERWN